MSTRLYDQNGNMVEGDFNFSWDGTKLSVDKELSAPKIWNAVWNDIADAINVPENTELIAGKCYCFNDNKFYISENLGEKEAIGIHSDTAGYILGYNPEKKQLKLAVAGFVLAYTDKRYNPGTPLICCENGYLTEATEDFIKKHPDRIIAHYFKDEEESYYLDVLVDNRNWVRVK